MNSMLEFARSERRLLCMGGLPRYGDEGLKRLTVEVEQENLVGRRFYEKMGFTEPRGLVHEVHGYLLKLVEYRRAISPSD